LVLIFIEGMKTFHIILYFTIDFNHQLQLHLKG